MRFQRQSALEEGLTQIAKNLGIMLELRIELKMKENPAMKKLLIFPHWFTLIPLLILSCRFGHTIVDDYSDLFDNSSGRTEGWIVGNSAQPCLRPHAIYHTFDPRVVSIFLGSERLVVDDQTGKILSSWKSKSPRGEITAAAPFNQSLHIAATEEKSVLIIDTRAGKTIYETSLSQQDDHPFYPLELGISADDRILAVVGSLKAIDSFPDPKGLARNNEIRENEDANRVHDLRLFLLDLEQKIFLGSIDFNDQYIRRVSFSRDNKLINVFSYTGIRIFDISNRSKISLISGVDISEFRGLFSDTFPFIFSADVSSDSRLAILSFGTSLVLFDLESRKIIPAFQWSLFPANFTFAIRWLAWSSDDRYVYASDLGASAYKFASKSGELLAKKTFDSIKQSWDRGPYFDYKFNRPRPGFAMSQSGNSFVTFAPQDPSKPLDCPGLEIHRMLLP